MAKNGFSMSNRVAVEQITASKTLTVDDCGKHFVVDSRGTSAITVTLPDTATAGDGWNCVLLLESGSTTNASEHVQSVAVTGATDATSHGEILFRAYSANSNGTGAGVVQAGTARAITISDSQLTSGDKLVITNVKGNALGFKYNIEVLTSGSANITEGT